MTTATVQPSPEGVPGAVADPTRIAGEDLTFAGAGGTQVNGYLARPADADAAGADPAGATRLRERAAASGQEVKVDVYEGAGHAFFADYRPNYRPAAAAKLWGEIVPFLAHNLDGA
jgi:hypothetical protein